MSAAALCRDGQGRVLLVKPAYRDDTWLLPGGGAEDGESPLEACRRELKEELALDQRLGGLLAQCWIGPEARGWLPETAQRRTHFPGDVMSVFDGGTLDERQISAIRCPDGEIAEFGFFSSVQAAELLSPMNQKIVLAALRAHLAGTGAVHLEDGRHIGQQSVLDRHQVHTRPRTGSKWPWFPGQWPPQELRVKQAWGWLFVPDGRVVLIVDPHSEPGMRIAMLPGGTTEADDADLAATLIREADEEARLALGEPALLGWLHDTTGAAHDGTGSCARVRFAAPVTRVGPAAPDPATGHTPVRMLGTPEQAAALLGFGDHGHAQASLAAALATERWNIPAAAPSPVMEIPAEGMTW